MAMSGIVDLYSPTANMYGIEPCPKCKSKYRYILNNRHDVIICDDCGFEEKVVGKKEA